MSTLLKIFTAKLLQQRLQFIRFFSILETNPPKNLDTTTDELDKEVWREIDCMACSNCCRSMTPTYTFQDMKRISTHFRVNIKTFKEKWLYKNRKGEWMNKLLPCQFLDLKTNKCIIYSIRPADCAGFPHLTKKKMVDYIHVHKQNVQFCPATFRFIEKLIDRMNEKDN
jgi:Fe-S-cluster containining protein